MREVTGGLPAQSPLQNPVVLAIWDEPVAAALAAAGAGQAAR